MHATAVMLVACSDIGKVMQPNNLTVMLVVIHLFFGKALPGTKISRLST
jgi:hypothetical protein